MFTRRTIVTAGIVAMLAAASLVGATAANADPIEHTAANQAALDALSAAGPRIQDYRSPDTQDAAAAAAEAARIIPVQDGSKRTPGASEAVGTQTVTSGSYQYSHSPDAPDLVPDGAVTPYAYVPGDLGAQPQPAPDTQDAAANPKPVAGGRFTAVSSDSDSGISGSDLLLGIGVAGGLALLVLLAMRGTKGTRPTLGNS
jgi:hypothetical protein